MKHVSPSVQPARRDRKDRNLAQGFLFASNVIATLLLLGSLLLLYAWPEKMPAYHLDEQTAQMFTLNLVSMLLLVAWLQRNLTRGWRAFTVAAAFIVLAQSWLVGLT